MNPRSGVNLDEEAANLIRFQQSYAAAAKIISTSQTIFDTLLSAATVMMRLSFNQKYDVNLTALIKAQEKMQIASNKLNFQTRILTPADDPSGAARVSALEQQIETATQFQTNSNILKNGFIGRRDGIKQHTRFYYQSQNLDRVAWQWFLFSD